MRVARGLQPRLAGSLLAIAVVLGTAGGLTTTLADSGFRARSAVDRLLAATHLPDVMMLDPTITPEQMEQIRAVPGVESATHLTGLAMFIEDEDYVNTTVPFDDQYGTELDVARIVRGRAADPDSADEMVIGEELSEALDVGVGDVVRFVSLSAGQIAQIMEEEPEGEPEYLGPIVELEVVGISRHPADLTTDDPL